jgi:Antibiotic biosynthesis monooxygenase
MTESNSSFAVIYRCRVREGQEAEFCLHWKTVASYFIAERGAIESRLHCTEEGLWVAYSRWPSREARDSSWPGEGGGANSSFPPHVLVAIDGLKSMRGEQLPEIAMSVVEVVSCV